MAYATLNELKGAIGIPLADTADDTPLQLALDAATEQIDQFCDRTFTADSVATARAYMVTHPTYMDVDPISTTTGLIVQTDDNADGTYETTWTLGTDFRLEPVNASQVGEPWTRLVALGTRWFPMIRYRPGLQVTAKFGWTGGVAPKSVKEACLLQAALLFKRKDAPFGVAGSVQFGSEMRILAKLDPQADSLLRPYRRNWWCA